MSATPIFSLRVPEVYESLETSANGLTNVEANNRLSLYGQNLLSKQRKTSFWEKLLREIARAPVVVLLIVGLAALLQRDGTVAGIIWSIVLINTALSFWREYRAEQATEKLRAILPSFTHVIRDGIENYIPSSEVVPGDVLVLAEG